MARWTASAAVALTVEVVWREVLASGRPLSDNLPAIAGGLVSVVFGSLFSFWLTRIIDQSYERRRLIEQLEATRSDLAAAEREGGRLAERQRLARDRTPRGNGSSRPSGRPPGARPCWPRRWPPGWSAGCAGRPRRRSPPARSRSWSWWPGGPATPTSPPPCSSARPTVKTPSAAHLRQAGGRRPHRGRGRRPGAGDHRPAPPDHLSGPPRRFDPRCAAAPGCPGHAAREGKDPA